MSINFELFFITLNSLEASPRSDDDMKDKQWLIGWRALGDHLVQRRPSSPPLSPLHWGLRRASWCSRTCLPRRPAREWGRAWWPCRWPRKGAPRWGAGPFSCIWPPGKGGPVPPGPAWSCLWLSLRPGGESEGEVKKQTTRVQDRRRQEVLGGRWWFVCVDESITLV